MVAIASSHNNMSVMKKPGSLSGLSKQSLSRDITQRQVKSRHFHSSAQNHHQASPRRKECSKQRP